MTLVNIGVKSRIDDPDLWPHVNHILNYLKDKGYSVKIEESMPIPNYERFKLDDKEVSMLDLLVVIGGDGTLLYTLSHLRKNIPPIMTVRWGRYGFLMEIEIDEFKQYFEKFLEGKYKIKEASRIIGFTNSIKFPPALNEYLLVTKHGKVVKLELYKDDVKLFSMVGDGVIVAPTTGSTAYSLSSGGPIVDEDLDVIVITPLNPIQLYLRPIVLPITSTLSIHVPQGSNRVKVIVDGMEREYISPGSTLTVKRYDKIRLIRFKNDYYDRVLRRNIM